MILSVLSLFKCNLLRFLKKLKIGLPCDPAILLLGIYPEKIFIQKDTCTPKFTAALFIVAGYGSNLNVPQQRKGQRRCGAYTQWNITQP